MPRSGRTRLEEAPGTDPISLTGPGLRGQALSLPGGQSRLCGEVTGEQSAGQRGVGRGEERSPCVPVCLATGINN